ncbi:hypothetical protein OIU74_021399 [Salix koriyanagi]|uniref:non-specific serine/threonine protein kinase n=1 Tax=Salix koriyanagi TaxID=2511006 RepID=A0A9Q0WI01_9ROSI|nr:hypothetical protein OIU74_021399 [Salix koriyanagi]
MAYNHPLVDDYSNPLQGLLALEHFRLKKENFAFAAPLGSERLLGQILAAVHHCHSRRVSHRDLKPANLLVDQKKHTLKVADFRIQHSTQETKCAPQGKTMKLEIPGACSILQIHEHNTDPQTLMTQKLHFLCICVSIWASSHSYPLQCTTPERQKYCWDQQSISGIVSTRKTFHLIHVNADKKNRFLF